MTVVTISEHAKADWPTLVPALAGAGIVAGVGPSTLYSSHDAASAKAGDVVIESSAPTTVPYLVSPKDGYPARIGFGFQDMAFGHALIADALEFGMKESVRLYREAIEMGQRA